MRKILKAIFPPVILKRAFLIYNRVKAKTWDVVFFGREIIPESQFAEHIHVNPFLTMDIDTSTFAPLIRQKFERWTDPAWTQDQYFLNFKRPGFLDDKTGWAITLKKKLIYPSLGFSEAPYVHKPAFSDVYFRTKKIIKVGKIISLRDTGEENYFHFYNDILAKIFYLKSKDVDVHDYVLVVTERLYSKAYFQFFLKNSFLRDLRWHVQRDEWLQFDEAIFCKPLTHSKSYYLDIVKMIDIPVKDERQRRIFLTRGQTSLRFIENIAALEPILRKYGFEIIDASKLTIENQIDVFSQCRYLVAIHGAGITNIIFRGDLPLSMLEIVHPGPYIPFHYIMLAKLFNYNFDVILGKKSKTSLSGGFLVDPKDLELKINTMLKLTTKDIGE